MAAAVDELRKSALALAAVAPLMAIWIIIFALLERRFPAAAHKPWKSWIFAVALSVLYLAVPVLISCVTVSVTKEMSGIFGGGLFDLRVDSLKGVAGAVAAAAIYWAVFDFFYYWWHRLQHENKALWAIHKLHHMDETLNVATALRQHWLEDVGRVPFIVIPMAILFNLTPQAGGVVGFLFLSWAFFIHANLKLNLGPASWLIAGPQLHRIHHSRLPEHFDRNYAAFYPIYDVLFGTYYHPRRGEFPPTGVRVDPDVSSMWDALVLPFRIWRLTLFGRSDQSVPRGS
jgi:sterol desaturase/sphingolipid hydroxylase (fatty acid hydroxylase superfamily)